MRRFIEAVAAVALAAMGIVAVLRVFHVEANALTIGLLALVPFLLLPAWVVLVWALASKKWLHAALAAVLVVAHLAFSVGPIGWRGAPDQSPAGDLRIGSANLLAGNPTSLDTVSFFIEADVDVVFLQEVTPELIDALAASTDYEEFPYRVLDPRPGFFGSAILSRLPMSGQVLWVDGWPMTEATIEHPEGDLHVVNVHVEPPLSSEGVQRWKRQPDELVELILDRSLPTLLVGDFNATAQHSTMHRLLDVGLTDAHEAAGSGLGSTWPAIGPLAVMQLDHALSTGELEPIDARLGSGLSSDHRPLVVTYGLSP